MSLTSIVVKTGIGLAGYAAAFTWGDDLFIDAANRFEEARQLGYPIKPQLYALGEQTLGVAMMTTASYLLPLKLIRSEMDKNETLPSN